MTWPHWLSPSAPWVTTRPRCVATVVASGALSPFSCDRCGWLSWAWAWRSGGGAATAGDDCGRGGGGGGGRRLGTDCSRGAAAAAVFASIPAGPTPSGPTPAGPTPPGFNASPAITRACTPISAPTASLSTRPTDGVIAGPISEATVATIVLGSRIGLSSALALQTSPCRNSDGDFLPPCSPGPDSAGPGVISASQARAGPHMLGAAATPPAVLPSE